MTAEVNMSDSDLLEQLNSEVVSLMTPLIVYLSVLMFVGLFGNILVCHYYGRQTKLSSHAVFICAVALFDLVSCAVSMPLEIVDTTFYYTFTNGHLCKFMSFVNYMFAIGSAFTLLAISVDRFRRICRPLKKQLDLMKCKLLCGLSFLLALIYSWPSLVFYTSVEVNLSASNGRIVKGYDCTTTKESNYKSYIWVFNCVYLITFIIGTGTLIVMYSLVGRSIYRHKRKLVRITKTTSQLRRSKHMDFDTTETHDEGMSVERDETTCERKSNDVQLRVKSIEKVGHNTRQTNEIQRKEEDLNTMSIKYTMIMLAITSVFIISFLPYLILVIVNEFLDLKDSAQGSALVGYKIGARSYFLNSALNPMVYGLLNPKFRKYYSARLFRCNKFATTSEALSSSRSTVITSA